ncbi:rod-binding protein [Parasphingorhabdus sp. JC815]|uniref:rod-binding protein n=1 Tax=Parasphingorhabdus sp. JC815 TaxID=3232140 RepID=UPI00345A4B5A
MTNSTAAASIGTPSSLQPRVSTERKDLEQAAQAFEAIFVRSMIGAMRQASLGDDLMGNNGSDQFRDMMDARVAEEMTKSNSAHINGAPKKGPPTKGLGIADMLITQWKDRL